LISTDMERIVQTLQWTMNNIPNFAQVATGLYILHTSLGPVFVAPLIVAIRESAAFTPQIIGIVPLAGHAGDA
jgi:hypothetical protein